MSKIYEQAAATISFLQPKERNAVWMVGEQLKDMLKAEPELAELVLQDLENAAMSLTNCEKKIKEYADKHKVGNCACVTPNEAERIIRQFYGLPVNDEDGSSHTSRADNENMVKLEDFFD